MFPIHSNSLSNLFKSTVIAASFASIALAQSGGSYLAYGTGCPGTGNQTPQLSNTGTPTIALGNRFSVDLDRARPQAAAVLFLGMQRVQWSLRGGCTLWTSCDFPIATVTTQSGRSHVEFPIPFNASLDGARFWNQWIVFDPEAKPYRMAMSGGGEARIGLPPPLRVKSYSPSAAHEGRHVELSGSGFGEKADDLYALYIPRTPGGCPPVLVTEHSDDSKLKLSVMMTGPQKSTGRLEIHRGQGARVRTKATNVLAAGDVKVWRGSPIRGSSVIAAAAMEAYPASLTPLRSHTTFGKNGNAAYTMLPTNPCYTCNTPKGCYPAGTKIKGYLHTKWSCWQWPTGPYIETNKNISFSTTLLTSASGGSLAYQLTQMFKDAIDGSGFASGLQVSVSGGRITFTSPGCSLVSVTGCIEICCPKQ